MTALLRATVVGINEYSDKRSKQHWLRFARADAEEMGMLLNSSKTFQVERIDVLTNERATDSAVRTSLLDHTFASRYRGSNTIALFYFAGHGVAYDLDDRIFLCCHDVDLSNPNKGGIRINDIYDMLHRSSADCNIAIIDSCFSGDIINVQDLTRVYTQLAAEKARKAIEAIQGREDKTIAIFASCRSSEKARETSELGHGVFTNELLCGWRDGASDQNGVVSLLRLADYLSQRFAADRQQAPQYTIRGAGQIALWQGPAREASTLPEVKPLPPTDSGIRVYGTVEIPKDSPKPQNPAQKRIQITALASVVGALLICGLATFVVPFLSTLFFWAVFIWGIALATLVVARWRWTIPLFLVHVVLLLGYGYDHFAWRFGNAMVDSVPKWLGGLEPFYWVLVIGETIGLGIFILLNLLRG